MIFEPNKISEEEQLKKQMKIDRITRLCALGLVFFCVYFFFIKLLFL